MRATRSTPSPAGPNPHVLGSAATRPSQCTALMRFTATAMPACSATLPSSGQATSIRPGRHSQSRTDAVNTGLTGIPYWGTDIGGFVPTREYDGELYVRWFQFGAFNPLFRSMAVSGLRTPR